MIMVKRKRMARLPKPANILDDFSKSFDRNLKSAVKRAGFGKKKKK